MNLTLALFWILRPKAYNCSFDRQRGSWFGKQSPQAVSSHNQPTYVQRSVLRNPCRAGLIALAAAFLSAGMAHAQGIYKAASCNYSDVNTVINGPTHTAINGDTIQIPAGDCTWTSGINVSASITITGLGGTPNSGPSTFGSGTNGVTILDNYASGPLFNLTPTYASSNNVTTIQNMNLDPINSTTPLYSPIVIEATSTSSGFPQVRIDNIYFGNTTPWTESGNSSNSVDMIRWAEAVGVMDHNTIPTGSTSNHLYSAQMASYLGVGQFGDNSWAQPDTMGSATNAFAENNQVYINGSTFNDCTEAPPGAGETSGGCRVVNRFNHATGDTMFDFTAVHGLDTTGRPRSGRHTEAYGNTVNCVNNCADADTSFRGGTGIVFGNTASVSGLGHYNQIFDFTVYREVYNPSPWSFCGGLNSLDPWDTNDNVVYYSGTISSGAGGYTITSSISGLQNLAPAGAPYSVYNTSKGFVTPITSNTTNTITVQPPIGENLWSFSNGDSFEIIRSTVCADQAGRGQGGYISGVTPSPASALSEALDPIYEWDDVVSPSSALSAQFGSSYSGGILQNRDFYTDNWLAGGLSGPTAQTSATVPFNGSTTCSAGSGNYTCGVGFGTLANRPTTCTTGVGYFATDQGSWNTSGNGFGQGELLKCTSTNTWTLAYTPYTYPHPLAGGTSSNTTPPPPSNLNGTLVQ